VANCIDARRYPLQMELSTRRPDGSGCESPGRGSVWGRRQAGGDVAGA